VPTYGYRCECGHEFDAVQRMSDEPVAECPECGKKARRLFFPAGIVFKGSGFYKTDSRGSGGGDGAAITSTASGPSKSSSDGASAPTTAAKTGD
jgi:putative FmdB family regulatory protein